MIRRRFALALLPLALLVASGVALAQRGWGGRPRGMIPDDRAGVPDWQVDDRFKDDVFTFVRVEYSSFRGGYGGGFGYGRRRGWGAGWDTDFPDSDLNFSFRLQQLTSLKVNPEPIHLPLTDERIYDYPFLYMIEPGSLYFSEGEVAALRRYLLSGGFLMVDDFWGDGEWENFAEQMRRVFPEERYQPAELPIDHEIFRCVYRLTEKPQIPSINAAWQGRDLGITWEMGHGGNTREPHYKGIFDDKGRMMAIICHNTDLGDGWEREGMDPWYFHEFSEKKAYPMGINIVTYAMTH